MTKFYLGAAIGALTLSLIAAPGYALDVGGSVGGSRDGGSSASASEGGSSASVSVGGRDSTADADANVDNAANASATVGGSDSTASVKANVGGNDASVDIGGGSGPTVSATQGGNPLDGISNTDVDVNFGALEGLLGGGGSSGGGNIDPTEAQTAFNSLSSNQKAELKVTCGAVLNAPSKFDAGMVQLCRILMTM